MDRRLFHPSIPFMKCFDRIANETSKTIVKPSSIDLKEKFLLYSMNLFESEFPNKLIELFCLRIRRIERFTVRKLTKLETKISVGSEEPDLCK